MNTGAAGSRPRLMVVVDTEEEFDWSAPWSREATTVRHMERIDLLQGLCASFGVKPVYVVDYPIASQAQGWRPLRVFLESGEAVIGAHLHPWVTPPYEEELNARNSYHGNLPEPLERAKLESLTRQIQDSFGIAPTIFKAGRYGIGPNTYRLLAALGYRIDLSPAPPLDFSRDGGPDFSRQTCRAYRDSASGLLVLPGTGAFCGWWPGDGERMYRWAASSWRSKLRAVGALSRSRAVLRVRLSPEDYPLTEMMTLTDALLRRGDRCFVLSLHSPSVMPGGTPYARTEEDVAKLLNSLKGYFEFIFGERNAEPWTPAAALQLCT